MTRKNIALVTLLAFVLFELTCTKIVDVPINQVKVPHDQGRRVLKVVKKSGEVSFFSKDHPARIADSAVVGIVSEVQSQIAVPHTEVASVEFAPAGGSSRPTKKIVTKSGLVYTTQDPWIIDIIPSEDSYLVIAKRVGADIFQSLDQARDVVILRSEVKSVTRSLWDPRQDLPISSIKLLYGKVYSRSIDPSITSIEEQSDRFIVHRNPQFSRIPFSNIELVKVKRSYIVRTLILVLGPLALLTGLALASGGGSYGCSGGGSISLGIW